MELLFTETFYKMNLFMEPRNSHSKTFLFNELILYYYSTTHFKIFKYIFNYGNL